MFTAIFLLVLLNARQQVFGQSKPPQVPCYFIFGDSLVDNGNNNPLQVQAKANYPPYGIDFPGGPTGRFTNGKNVADIIAEKLGFNQSIPPYATAKGEQIINGVNYASGSAGILDETGRHQGDVISMNEQLQHHQAIILSLSKVLKGVTITAEHLQKCLYTVGMGNNDYINNYLMPDKYKSKSLYSQDQFATMLSEKYYSQLKPRFSPGSRYIGAN
ncbi:lipase [Lithospermum erythrorhizon]|uniref:Lipase n=1 Tax=Lithospermum erythrorhizon TaxID=34254 RepID=A0AAV3RCL8_LITER